MTEADVTESRTLIQAPSELVVRVVAAATSTAMVATTAAATKEETEDKNTSAGPDKAIPQTAKLDVAAKAITDQGAGGPPVPTMAGADPQGGPLAAVESTTSQMVRSCVNYYRTIPAQRDCE